MYSPLTLDALRVLDAIARRGSFAAAADELFRVPSALSYTVAKLEEDLGVTLFNRDRRKAELTPVGRLVLEQGRHILTATEALTRLARASENGWEAVLRIAVDSVLELDLVYDLIADFRAEGHATELQLLEEVLGGCWDALSSDRCDLVIGAVGDPPGGGLATHCLGEIDFVFAVAGDHPLCALPQPVPLDAVHAYPTVVAADSSRDLPARSVGLLDGRSRIVVSSVEQKIAMQRRGLGVGLLPLFRIREHLADGTLRVLALDNPPPPLRLSVAWRRDNRGKAVHWFIERLRLMRFEPMCGLMAA